MKNQYALVTGAAKRIGAEISKTLAAQGYNLILHYFQSRSEVMLLHTALSKQYPKQKFSIVKSNLSKPSGIKKLSKIIKEKYVQILVNNASIFTQDDDNLTNFSPEKLVENQNIHFIAPIILFWAISCNQNAKIINILDFYRTNKITHESLVNYGRYFSYSVTKHAKFLAHQYLLNEIKEKKLNIKLFALYLGHTLNNHENKSFFEKNGITDEMMEEKILKITKCIEKIVTTNELENQIFEII
jgi:short-subunit dehydrogenase